MRNLTRAKVGLAAVGAITLAVGLISPAANADYAPGPGDIVGVGSDTVQNASDFVADGDNQADAGYNSAGNINRVINFDATPDANARLAYGASGLGNGTNCAPGTGGTAGTGNQNANHADSPCTLNPTVVLRAGLNPVQRPNGSGAGTNALLNDTCAAPPATCGTGPFVINYARRSSAAGSTAVNTAVANFGGAGLDSITIGNDGLAMLSSSTTNAVALSAAQLNSIYACTATTWTAVGGASSATIVPLLPQIGSGTRSSFLTAIGSPVVGSCVVNVEENDPEAIDQSSSPANAIEPMSSGRLNLYQGINGSANGIAGGPSGFGGYFKDPSCAFGVTTPAACVGAAKTLAPNVKYWTTGTPSSGTLFNINRSLFVYFRDVDVNSATPFQPGSSLNWVRTLFYNPCSGAGHTTGCTTVGGIQYGPGGPPYYATSAGQSLIASAGINATYASTIGGP
jgi:ABC-type phosphate transport system substrate-binding protein